MLIVSAGDIVKLESILYSVRLHEIEHEGYLIRRLIPMETVCIMRESRWDSDIPAPSSEPSGQTNEDREGAEDYIQR